MLIPITLIDPNPWQPRLTTDPATLAGITASINKSRDEGVGHNGFWQPLLMRKINKRYQIPFGHTRLAAYKLANPDAKDFPGDVVELSDRQMSDMAAEENCQRKDLSPIETARAIERRMADFKLSQLEAGQPFGYTSQGSVANLLRLLKLPAAVQTAVADGTIPERIARQMIQVVALFPKESASLIEVVKNADPDSKDEALAIEMSDLLQERGLALQGAPFDLDWPDKPIALNGDATPDLPELRRCVKCPSHFSRDGQSYCLLLKCYDLKVKHALALIEANACAKLNLTPLAANESGNPIFDLLGWQDREKTAKALLAAHKKDPSLQLRLKASVKDHNWLYKTLADSEHAVVYTTNPVAVRQFAAQFNAPKNAPAKPAANTGATVLDSAADEAARDERRAERAVALRIEHDVVWLIKNVTPIIAKQLTISGHTLAYVVEQMSPARTYTAAEFYGLLDWADSFRKALEPDADKPLKGALREDLQRQRLVVYEIFDHVFQSNYEKNAEGFAEIIDGIEMLAVGKADLDEACFHVKLPKGWSEPPVHSTDYNCWTCGTFAAQRRLTKGDIERGWESRPSGVVCPDCASKPASKTKRK